jgi:hypothetical protein
MRRCPRVYYGDLAVGGPQLSSAARGAPAVTNIATPTAAGVWKPPRDETAGKGTYEAVPARLLWGFGRGRPTAELSSEGRLSGEDSDGGRQGSGDGFL